MTKSWGERYIQKGPENKKVKKRARSPLVWAKFKDIATLDLLS